MVVSSLNIAKRNLGREHLGVLMSKAHLANLYVQMQRYQEAEELLHQVIQREKYVHCVRADGEHPDRIAALWYLMSCYMIQNKWQEALDISLELSRAIENCGGEGLGKHLVMAKKVDERRRENENSLGEASQEHELLC